jgi:uncharacterized protein (DUF952 family)
MTRETLHLVPEATWTTREPTAPYLPAAYPQDGFVHCTDGDENMLATANRFYAADPQPFLLLTLDLDRTGSPWQFDDPSGIYPHVYGPIDPASVLEVRRFLRSPDGTFTGLEPG